MPSERYVALGLARVRTPWFSDVARWSTSGSLAMDFVKTVSVGEVRARLESGRPFSALLVDGGLPGVDRDLLELAREHGCAPIVVVDGTARDWSAIGAADTLPTDFGRTELEAVLAEHAVPIGRVDDLPGQAQPATAHGDGFLARVVAVTGPGGTGRSVVAMAVAQGAAADPAHTDTVVLADLALNADQAMLHDARDVIPGVLELVEAHRSGAPAPEDVRAVTFDIVARRYRLLLGLRRHRDWTAIRPRALRSALDGLRRSFTLVVADVDDDLEGEATTGSADVEDRNLLARTTVAAADVVVVVGAPGTKGAHSLLRVVRDCIAAGVTPDRIVPVVNRAPRNRTARAETSRAVTELLAASNPGQAVLSPVFLPERKVLDDVLRDGVALPEAMVAPVSQAVQARLEVLDDRLPALSFDEPVLVDPGSLGSWDEEVAG
jgi:MinD-like ATPase involved in chromosome partitioning or flagellar assembly